MESNSEYLQTAALPPQKNTPWIKMILAVLFLTGIWLGLDWKLVMGEDWMSATYDHEDWRTNEGNLHTFGAWDLETHIWKAEYIMENFPHFHWNPYWYLGMPLVKYYPSGFYFLMWATMAITGITAAKTSIYLITFGHLLAVLLTFYLCYRISHRVWVSALLASFVLSSSFLTLRSYGWEPITVVFLFLFPLGMLAFLRKPTEPFRFDTVAILGISFLCHPLLWFSLCMSYGLYLFSIAVRPAIGKQAPFLWMYILLVLSSIAIGAVQFIPQITYDQVTSGAHMGMKYLPFYQVGFNIISPIDFLFDTSNLKGPGPIILVAVSILVLFAFWQWKDSVPRPYGLLEHRMTAGLLLILMMMIAFYYFELYDIFPMNLLRSIQYHRIIPEFIIVAAMLVASLSNFLFTARRRIMYHSIIVLFFIASLTSIYIIQEKWNTSSTIFQAPEFIYDEFAGRITFPYTDQSLSVRNSFTKVPQAYGYYEQGVQNPYADEIFSVSSGYHNGELTKLYLQATHVSRLYVNKEEGLRDRIVEKRFNETFEYVPTNNTRYGYFSIPMPNEYFAQAVSLEHVNELKAYELGCRELYQETYCGSIGEEFVGTDPQEILYLEKYVELLKKPSVETTEYIQINPDLYHVHVKGATADTAIIVKMTYDGEFRARVNGQRVDISPIGPYFMLISPKTTGDYTIELKYGPPKAVMIGLIISITSFSLLSIYFLFRKSPVPYKVKFPQGDLA